MTPINKEIFKIDLDSFDSPKFNDARWLPVQLPDGRQIRVIYTGEPECEWTKHPPEFGAPYKLRFVDPAGRTIRFGVGVFLPISGGGWYIWGPQHPDCYLASYDPSKPLCFSGNPNQTFTSYMGEDKAGIELPEIFQVFQCQRPPGVFLFGEEESLTSKITNSNQKHKNHIFTRYDSLKPTASDTYRVHCPICGDGVLFMARDPKTHTLLPYDNCVQCGQGFQFIDMDTNTNGRKL